MTEINKPYKAIILLHFVYNQNTK